MKKFIALFIMLSVLSSCSAQKKNNKPSPKVVSTQNETSFGLKGCDPAKVEKAKLGKTYIYPKLKVAVKASGDVGEEIEVTFMDSKEVLKIENVEAHHFSGIKDGFLFIDNGKGPNGRTIVIYDIKTKQNIHSSRYEKDISFKDGKMVYLAPIDTRTIRLRDSVCPDKEKWEKQGLSAGYGMYMAFDFKTKTAIETGNYSCYPIQ